MIRALYMFMPMLISSVIVVVIDFLLKLYGLKLVSLAVYVIIISIGSCFLSIYFKVPVWWKYINTCFPLLVFLTSAIDVGSNIFIIFFGLTLLIYKGAIFDRVPLYLSSEPVVDALSKIASYRNAKKLVDIGSGTGTVVFGLSRRLDKCCITGIENAPLTWLVGLTAKLYYKSYNVTWIYGSMWRTNLGDFDIVYAFLSPDPMTRLWRKATSEMGKGAILISNSFPIDGVVPASVEYIKDKRGSVLYCYIPSEYKNVKAAKLST